MTMCANGNPGDWWLRTKTSESKEGEMPIKRRLNKPKEVKRKEATEATKNEPGRTGVWGEGEQERKKKIDPTRREGRTLKTIVDSIDKGKRVQCGCAYFL